MKRDDVIAGVIGGTIFVVGCTVGIFGYHKMNEPLFAQTTVEESAQSFSYGISGGNGGLIRSDQEISVYEPEIEESNNKSVITEGVDGSSNTVEENNSSYQERDELMNEVDDTLPPKVDPDAIDRLSDNTQFIVDTSGNSDNNDYNFNKYNNKEQQKTSETYVLNTSTLKIHHPRCEDVKKISPQNYATSSETIDDLRSQGYSLCGHCFR